MIIFFGIYFYFEVCNEKKDNNIYIEKVYIFCFGSKTTKADKYWKNILLYITEKTLYKNKVIKYAFSL